MSGGNLYLSKQAEKPDSSHPGSNPGRCNRRGDVGVCASEKRGKAATLRQSLTVEQERR